MVEDKTTWKDTCERYVAFIDIMGFKDRLLKGHGEAREWIEYLYPSYKAIKEDIINYSDVVKLMSNVKKTLTRLGIITKKDQITLSPKIHDDFTMQFVKPIYFSDSIILTSIDDSFVSAHILLGWVNWILYQAFEYGVPIKGAIAYGEMTAALERSLYFGQPLVDAFELHNELKIYGVVLHHSAEEQLKISGFIDIFDVYQVVKYKVPMKSGKITHYLLDWTPNTEVLSKDPIELVNMLYDQVSGAPRIYIDNTLDFICEIQRRKAELAKHNKDKPV